MLQAEVPLVPIDLLLETEKKQIHYWNYENYKTCRENLHLHFLWLCLSKLLILIQASRVLVDQENLQRCMCGSPSRLQSLKQGFWLEIKLGS